MAHTGSSFVILKQVDSTNNYAMAKVHAGMAKHGVAYFSSHQSGGKGQRGKAWYTGEGNNIALSVILSPGDLNIVNPFQLSCAIALATFDFFSSYAGEDTRIKWPNDIYWRDRKAGGVLIENSYSGKEWKWSVAGIGININQPHFDGELKIPVSLMQITGKKFETETLATELHQFVLKRTAELLTKSYETLLLQYNCHLYKAHEVVKFKKANVVFETMVMKVNSQGQLVCQDNIERCFDFGEVEWLL